MYPELGLFIGGTWKMAGDVSRTEDVIDPSTGRSFALLPHASKSDLDEALEAAKRGFAVWRAMSAYDRAKIMHNAADLLRERHELVSRIIVQEQGKVYAEARAEVLMSVDVIDWYAEEGRRSYGRIVPGRTRGVRQLVVHEPVEIVAAFTPWNFPIVHARPEDRRCAGRGLRDHHQGIRGNTRRRAWSWSRCFADAGLPEGVLNLVFGVPSESVRTLADEAPQVKKISFTGSIPVGKHLARPGC